MVQIVKERREEIIKLYESGKKDLFNWCEEYKTFISECVLYCVSSEWDYMLKKSYDDNESPVNYEDLDLFDIERAKEHLLYNYENNEEEYTNYANDEETFNRKVKNKGDFEVFLNSLSKEELKIMFDDLSEDISNAQGEVFEWWLISDPLNYRLEKQEEIFLNGAWGRQSTGQSISLDSNVIKAFIDWLKDIY